MTNELRQHIGEAGYPLEPVTGIYFQPGEMPWQLWKLERDVEFDGITYRCVIIEKDYYDPDDLEAVDHTEDIMAEAWAL